MRGFQKPQFGWLEATLHLHHLPQLTRLISIIGTHVDSVAAFPLEASPEEAVLSPEVDIISLIRTLTEGVV